MKNNNFAKFMESYLVGIAQRTGKSKTDIMNESGISRQMIYRWMQKGIFPKPINLYKFFYNTTTDRSQEMLRSYISQAYQELLIDFYDRKEQTFC